MIDSPEGQTHYYGDGCDPPHHHYGDGWEPKAERRARHSLYVGWVAGIAMRHGLVVEFVVDDDGNYTDRLEVRFGADLTITLVVPEPPDEWTLG